MTDEVILARIKKLLALATSDNVNESAEAQKAAQRLLIKHNIDENELNEFSLEKNEKVVEVHTSGKNGQNRSFWYNRLAHIVAQANLCDLLTSGAGLIWIGKPTNIEIAQYLFDVLAYDLQRIATNEWVVVNAEQKTLPKYYRKHGKTWKNSFYVGACQTIQERLNANLRELKGAPDVMALVVNNDIELDEYKKIHYPRLSYSHSNARSDRSGIEAGKAAGRSISFATGVGSGGSAAPKLIKG